MTTAADLVITDGEGAGRKSELRRTLSSIAANGAAQNGGVVRGPGSGGEAARSAIVFGSMDEQRGSQDWDVAAAVYTASIEQRIFETLR